MRGFRALLSEEHPVDITHCFRYAVKERATNRQLTVAHQGLSY
jgi:hypothetical protein